MVNRVHPADTWEGEGQSTERTEEARNEAVEDRETSDLSAMIVIGSSTQPHHERFQ